MFIRQVAKITINYSIEVEMFTELHVVGKVYKKPDLS